MRRMNDDDPGARLDALAGRALERLRAVLGDDAGLLDAPANAGRVGRVAIASDFAIDTLQRQPGLLKALLADDGAAVRPAPALDADAPAGWPRLLRLYRAAESTRLAWRDVLGLDDIDDTLTGSTRLKAGTAQKMILNMITTTIMIKLGRVEGNKMVNMQLTNQKLVDRGTRMIVEELGLSYEQAHNLLLLHGSVKAATDSYKNNVD